MGRIAFEECLEALFLLQWLSFSFFPNTPIPPLSLPVSQPFQDKTKVFISEGRHKSLQQSSVSSNFACYCDNIFKLGSVEWTGSFLVGADFLCVQLVFVLFTMEFRDGPVIEFPLDSEHNKGFLFSSDLFPSLSVFLFGAVRDCIVLSERV